MSSSGCAEINNVNGVAEFFESGKSLDVVVAGEFFSCFRMDIGDSDDFYWNAVNSHISLEVKSGCETCARRDQHDIIVNHAQCLLAGGLDDN